MACSGGRSSPIRSRSPDGDRVSARSWVGVVVDLGPTTPPLLDSRHGRWRVDEITLHLGRGDPPYGNSIKPNFTNRNSLEFSGDGTGSEGDLQHHVGEVSIVQRVAHGDSGRCSRRLDGAVLKSHRILEQKPVTTVHEDRQTQQQSTGEAEKHHPASYQPDNAANDGGRTRRLAFRSRRNSRILPRVRWWRLRHVLVIFR